MSFMSFVQGQIIHELGKDCNSQAMEHYPRQTFKEIGFIWDKFVPIKFLIIFLISSLKDYFSLHF